MQSIGGEQRTWIAQATMWLDQEDSYSWTYYFTPSLHILIHWGHVVMLITTHIEDPSPHPPARNKSGAPAMAGWRAEPQHAAAGQASSKATSETPTAFTRLPSLPRLAKLLANLGKMAARASAPPPVTP